MVSPSLAAATARKLQRASDRGRFHSGINRESLSLLLPFAF